MKNYDVKPFELFDKQWGLLTAGTRGRFNAMTISWGGLGTLWGRPVATVYVKPARYTHRFMEENKYFTVSFYPPEQRQALEVLGTMSGRDGDKIAVAGLSPVYLNGAVTYNEAEITLVCEKIYSHDLELDKVPDWAANAHYTTEEPHTMYIGRVLQIIRG